MKIQNKKIDEDDFLKQRKEVLAMWPTGKDVDLDEAISYQKSMPPHKNLVNRLSRRKEDRTDIVSQPRRFHDPGSADRPAPPSAERGTG